LLLSYVLKILKLFLLILIVTYLLAIVFRVINETEADYSGHQIFGKNDNESVCPVSSNVVLAEEADTFIVYNDLDYNVTMTELVIMYHYFSFTSLTTVGFGDFHPRSDLERGFIAFALLFGVALFSYIMGNFIDILASYNQLYEINDESEGLYRFFGILTKFNRGKPLNPRLVD